MIQHFWILFHFLNVSFSHFTLDCSIVLAIFAVNCNLQINFGISVFEFMAWPICMALLTVVARHRTIDVRTTLSSYKNCDIPSEFAKRRMENQR